MNWLNGSIPENKEELVSILKDDVLDVTFIKSDGSERKMRCTLMTSYLPVGDSVSSKRSWSTDAIAVWDIEKNDWRVFKFSSIKDVRLANV